jgi:hypothetical protein
MNNRIKNILNDYLNSPDEEKGRVFRYGSKGWIDRYRHCYLASQTLQLMD